MPGTTRGVRPITVPEEQMTRRPSSRTSLGDRSHTSIPTAQTTEVKLRRTSAKDRKEQPEPQGVLITEGLPYDEEVGEQGTLEIADGSPQPDEDEPNNECTSNDGGSYYDITADNGYDTDLEIDDEEFITGPEEFDPSGIKDYVKECNRLGVIPCSYFSRHVHDANFCMRNHGLGPLGAKAIAKPLEFNTSIEVINLEGNCIEAEGAKYLSRMLKDNTYITEINLSENNLGSNGARAMCETLADNSSVKVLDLSGNNFTDLDGDYFLKLLESNSTISKLYLSHNNFGVNAAKSFKEALSVNESLRVLDLGWNQFRLKGACHLADGIKENYGLKELYLSMNGFAKEGTKSMGQALKQNQCLMELDLSSNRITAEGALDIGRALQTNSDLRFLKIGGNPISHIGALTLLTAISKNENTEMNYLHMAGVVIDDDFDALHMSIQDTRPFKVVHGGLMSKKRRIKIGYGRPCNSNDSMSKLREYASKAGLRLVDLFKQFDKDKSWTVDREEFRQGIKKSGIDMSESEMQLLIDKLDKDKDGEIDYGELVFGDNEHRETQRKMKTTTETQEDQQSVCSVDAMLNMLDVEDPDEPTET